MQTPFNIIETQPLNDMRGIDINQIISIKFTHEVNTRTIDSNVFLLKNVNDVELDKDNFDINLYEKVKIKKTYENRTIFLKPINQLDKNTEYIIHVTDQIQNSIDDFLFKSLIINFETSFEHEYKAPKIISPEYGQIFRSEKVYVKFYNLESEPEAFEIELSTDKFFEDIIGKDVITNTHESVLSYEFEGFLKEGSYYIRVRALNGLYSETKHFFYKENVENGNYLGSENQFDVSEDIVTIDELRLVETFPDDNFSNVSTNINIIYFKFYGKAVLGEFDINNSNVTGRLIDMNDLYNNQTDHGELEGNWEFIYDERTNHSYIIFNLNEVI